MEMRKLVMSEKKLLIITELFQGQELIASQCFETQLLNSLLQSFYKENIAEYHSSSVLIIEWAAEAE